MFKKGMINFFRLFRKLLCKREYRRLKRSKCRMKVHNNTCVAAFKLFTGKAKEVKVGTWVIMILFFLMLFLTH